MSELRELIENEIKRPSVFVDESVLYPEYIPPIIRHRDEQLKSLVRLFKPVILSPGSTSVKALLAGPVGSGKTVTAAVFGREISHAASSKGLNLKYVHVNCSRSKNLPNILREVKDQLGIPIPDRGLSTQEMLEALLKLLDREDIFTIITLDEFDYFIQTASVEDKYTILRLYDIFKDEVKRINFIFVARGSPANIWSRLDSITGGYLMKNLITFEPYKSKELFTILKDRADRAFHIGVVGDEVLDYISKITGYDTGGDGNARKALAILHAAGKLADKEMAEGKTNRVTIDHVRMVVSQEYPSMIELLDTLHYLPLHEILILKAILLSLKESGEDYVSMGTIEKTYRKLCEDIGEEPRGHTKVYMFVLDLKRRNIILTKNSIKGRKGRSTYVGFGMAPLDPLLQRLDILIKQKLVVR